MLPLAPPARSHVRRDLRYATFGSMHFELHVHFGMIRWLTEYGPSGVLVVVSEVIPFALGFMFVDLLSRMILFKDEISSLELMLDSPTFVDFFTDGERVFALTNAIRHAAVCGSLSSVNVLVAHGAEVDGELCVFGEQK